MRNLIIDNLKNQISEDDLIKDLEENDGEIM